MLVKISHRGPDDDGRLDSDGLSVGMRRLSIIDLAGGKQPIYNESGRFAVILNGEIYNYRELRSALEKSGHTFRTDSDTEAIVHLYEDHGADCVQFLQGMFAFAVWDAERRELFIARDRLGIKPLYYADVDGQLVFASEIKALVEHPSVKPRMSLAALNHYLSLRYVPAPLTLFEGIYALLPAHHMTVNHNGVRIARYWNLVFEDLEASPVPESEYVEQLESLLLKIVDMHLMSDVPFGAFLSGGIDSSIVVAMMTHLLQRPVNTFSVGYAGSGEDNYSELAYARLCARRYNAQHHEVYVSARDFIDNFEKVCWHLDQPIADYAEVAYFTVSQEAARHVKMVLTGEGGDELFAGYGRYVGELYAPAFRHMPKIGRDAAVALADRLSVSRRPKATLFALTRETEAERHIHWLPMLNSQRKSMLLDPGLREQLKDQPTSAVFEQWLGQAGTRDPINRMLYVDTNLWLPDYLLSRGDKLTMAASLEGRVPLLDHTLVEFAARVPVKFKINNFVRKYLLRKMSAKWIPDEIIHRKKQGFPVPVPRWLRQEAQPLMRDLLASDVVARRGYFTASYVQELIKEHESGAADNATILYGLMNLEVWMRQYIDG